MQLGYMLNAYSAHVEPNDSYRGQHHDQERSMLSRSLEYDTDCTALHRQGNHSVESQTYCHPQYNSQNGYPPQEAPMPMNYYLMNGRLSSSLDNADVMRPHNIMLHVEPHIHRPVPPPAIGTPHSYSFGANNDLPLMTEQRRVPEHHQMHPQRDEPHVRHHCPPSTYLSPSTQWMAGRDQMHPPRDEPQVRHYPPPTYLSPTQWMEEGRDEMVQQRDEPQVRHCPPPTYLSPTQWMEGMYEPVTITEEDSYDARTTVVA
jgi:hypothetical protein